MSNTKLKSKLYVLAFLLFNTAFLQAQSNTSDSNYVLPSLIGLAAILLIAAVIRISDNLLVIEAHKSGLDVEKNNYSIFPKMGELKSGKIPSIVEGGKIHRFKKGFDIKLVGSAKESYSSDTQVNTYAVKPGNFRGIAPIPKVIVEVGDEVKAGDVLFYDKKDPRIKYVAPVSGEIVAINRGDKRAIKEIVILADKEMKYRDISLPSATAGRQELVEFLLESGVWPMINQRPFDEVADPDAIPENIFVSTFDTAPLAPNLNFVVNGKNAEFQKGLDILARLTNGQVFLGLDAREKFAISTVFTQATGVSKNWFQGPHPSGNVGIQIHHTDPIKGADKVWTLGVQEVINMGSLFLNGRFDASRKVALTGAEISNPIYVDTHLGASVKDILQNQTVGGHSRIIAGDVLSGTEISMDSFLNAHDDQITVVKENDNYEMFGWLLPLKPRPSISGTFPNFLYPDHEFEAETNTHGEKRAFVMTGQYESVLPMDIYPQHLMKAIITNDYERMEGLGITELSEEDIALCEFVCTSKMPLQSILRTGLDMIKDQG